MFAKILIANRGEIACRIIKTAKAMGIETVAVYSTIDKDSLHVKLADYAFHIGEAPAIESYLNVKAIIHAAVQSKAEAIHPGYGFLSENPEFCEAVSKAGLIFIGPPLEAIKIMASKQEAKQQLESRSIPLIPGYHGKDQTDKELLKKATELGFPVLIKAALGGGGKGMRPVYHEKDFFLELAGAKREALASFANDTMIIEKYLLNPRHIEVQIMADNFGQLVHLFERDCSIQRRHQKIIEEAPAVNLSTALRSKLTSAAILVAASINYRGAGTVEFLVDANENFYFIEMNTRLQVEHPVTEMITGLDLVAWQIKIAANYPLPVLQSAITAFGHAIECRIYAEDSQQQRFIPSTGKLSFLKEPSSKSIRIDSGFTEGSEISQFYDPMIAKLIAFGESREEALQKLQWALRLYAIGGVKTNIFFLQAILAHPKFKAANLNINFLKDEKLNFSEPDYDLALKMAVGFDYLALSSKIEDSLYKDSFAFEMHLDSSWTWYYLINSNQEKVNIYPQTDQQFIMEYKGKKELLIAELKKARLSIVVDLERQSAFVEQLRDGLNIYLSSSIIYVQPYLWQKFDSSYKDNTELKAPMPATVVAVLKKVGDQIQKGEQLVVLEAMKMEHSIYAPKAGIIREIFYDRGSQVQEGAELLALEDKI